MKHLSRILRRLLLKSLTEFTSKEWAQSRVSFSQFGEDLIIKHLLESTSSKQMTYVDVGCYDPIYLSNTYFFYKLGWHGLVIDANPKVINRYSSARPRDMAVNAFVCESIGFVDFSVFQADMFSTLSSIASKVPDKWRKCEQRLRIPSATLNSIIEHSNVRDFSLLNIDAEGSDLNVLKSLDLLVYQPAVICCEDHAENWHTSETFLYLDSFDYHLCGRAGLSSLYAKTF
jgi:FkbM family methyltransferase